MNDDSALTLILAAGKGTRMRTNLPKVLHKIAGLPMLGHVMAVAGIAGRNMAIVTSPGQDDVRQVASQIDDRTEIFIQEQQLGTAHAVLAARPALEQSSGEVLVLYGDTPLLRAETISRLMQCLQDGADLAVLGFEAADPTGYGRLILDEQNELASIREHKDASEAERQVTLCNSGVFAFKGGIALGLLDRIGNDNAKGEYYLTDAVALARQDGLTVRVIVCNEEEVLGVNSRKELAIAERAMQDRLRHAAMDAGVTLVAPETIFFSADTKIENDVIVEPHVVFGPDVEIATGAHIKSFSHLEGATLHQDAVVGPYARLRPRSGRWRTRKNR